MYMPKISLLLAFLNFHSISIRTHIVFLAILISLHLLSLSVDWAEILHVMFHVVYLRVCKELELCVVFEISS